MNVEIPKEIMTYCPKCNKHTMHTITVWSRKPVRGQNVATRRHNRAIKGYVGSVEPKIKIKKLGKHQKALLKCKVCKYTVERVFGGRTRKKLEIKHV
jgi:large subunit ribosomal protein L44e